SIKREQMGLIGQLAYTYSDSK
ncbi:MAG: hypothetical protein K0R67_542, partial [Paenibacillus sp.]|nr:hypothetical protein [Paenibacillus sp.]